MIACFEWFTKWVKEEEKSGFQDLEEGVIYYKESSYDIVTNEFVKYKISEVSELIKCKVEVLTNDAAENLLSMPANFALSKYNLLSDIKLKEVAYNEGVICCKLHNSKGSTKVIIVNIENCTRNIIIAAFLYVVDLLKKSLTEEINCVESKKICPTRDCPSLLPQLLLESEDDFKEKSLIVYDKKKERLVFSDDGTPFLNDRMAEAYYIFVLKYPKVSFVDLKKEDHRNSLLNIYNNIKRNSDIKQIECTINNFIGLRKEGEIKQKKYVYNTARSHIKGIIRNHFKNENLVYQNKILEYYDINKDNMILKSSESFLIPDDID